MVNSDSLVLHIQVADRQSYKFGDSQASMEQDVHRIVILAVVLVLFDKGEELSHLVSADGFTCVGIIDHNLDKFKVKGILADVIILHCHCKSGAQNATDAMDGTVAPLVLCL